MKCSVTLYSSLSLVILHLLTCSNNYLGTFLRNDRGGSLKMCILSHFNKYGVYPVDSMELISELIRKRMEIEEATECQ